ncbi:restriction endonuclease [Dyella flagellata]|uniref:restriction endonuclease n=1 Tax=Dyella flagellata TaxID=1867833 RepID=UPI0024E0FEA9|nr:restriction endonuclease [Dyella flagellata]
MGRRKHDGIEVVSKLPWQAGIVLGVAGYAAMRYGLAWCMTMFGGPVGQALGNSLADGAYAPAAWLLLIACWLAALISYLDGRRRHHLLASQSGLRSLSAMDWREFEMLVGEAFRRQGYKVREIGLGGADGGVDLILHKDSATILVQCKQWRTKLVDVRVVREMYGLLMHHRADAVKIVAIGHYTDDAQRFVHGKPIELIAGDALLAMVRECRVTARPPKPVKAA